MSNHVELCEFLNGEQKVWDDYVMSMPGSSWTHLSGWKAIIDQVYRHKGFYFWAKDGDKIKGILPLILMRTYLFDPLLVSLPFLDEGGICADDDETAVALFHQAENLAKSLGVQTLEFRHRSAGSLDLPVFGNKVSMVLELADNSKDMWDKLNAKVRNQVRKATKSGLTVRWVGGEGIENFYDVFAVNMRDLGSPVHSKAFFQSIQKEFSSICGLLLVSKEDKTIGGGVCVKFKDTLCVPWASSLRQYGSLCPNNLLYWEALRWGCDNGFTRFDFGRSSPGGGTYQFKKQWGATEYPLHWQYGAKGKKQIHLDNESAKLQWFVKIWRGLPLPITKAVGPILRRQISN